MKMQASASQSNAQLRKIKKPLIERRRRERINDSLCQLKTLVLEATNRDESCYSKMEKADILEMTVSHLRSVQSHSASFPASSSLAVTSSNRDDAVKKYLFGFNECAKEVAKYLSGVKELADDSVVSALMSHLSVRLSSSFRRSPAETQFPSSKQSLCSEVDENGNLLAGPVMGRLAPELSESVRPSITAAMSLNRDLFCEIVSLSVSTSSSSNVSPNCRASVAAKRSARESSGSVDRRESPYLSADDPRSTQHCLRSRSDSSQENLPFALKVTKKCHSVISRSSVATSTSAVIPVLSTEVENAVTLNETRLQSGSIWRPW